MGLASKLAASQASGPAAYPGGPPTGGPSQSAGYPGQPQYQAYPGGPQQSSSGQSATSGPPYPGGPANLPVPNQANYSQPQQRPVSPYGAPPPPPRLPSGSPQPPRPAGSPQPYQQPQWQRPPPSPNTNPYGPQPGSSSQQPYSQSQHSYNFAPQYQQPQQYGQPTYTQGGGGYGPPSGGYGGPQQQQQQQPQQQYGGGQPQPSQNAGAYRQLLQAAIQEKALQNFYPPNSPALESIVSRAPQQVAQLAQQWRINQEIASDIVKLALYDVILYIDDSGSMAFEENGERIDDLKLILSRVAFATSLFDEDGIQVRFMNSTDQGNGIRSEAQVTEMIARTRFSGLTPMGREMQNKILGPLVLGPARSGQLRKPILVITITDGQPTGESSSDVARIMKSAADELHRNPRYGKGALAFQFAQVGNDLKAREFLGKLDEEPSIGDIIDCTSNYEVEADEMMHANPPVQLSPELWLIKLLLGAIDSSYDTKDEKAAGGSRPPPPQSGGYGGPPQGQYGGYPQQQGGYPQQQQGGYPQQQQQGGYPPYGQQGQQQQGGYGGQPQGQYNRPPPNQQGGSYPGQGGYGAPPPPPRY